MYVLESPECPSQGLKATAATAASHQIGCVYRVGYKHDVKQHMETRTLIRLQCYADHQALLAGHQQTDEYLIMRAQLHCMVTGS